MSELFQAPTRTQAVTDHAAHLDQLLAALAQHEPESAAGRVLHNAVPDVGAARRWLAEQKRRQQAPIVFRWTACGYVEIGLEGESLIYEEPPLWGLDLAHRVLMHGVTASAVLCFPAGAASVRNALARAADWIDPRCVQLASLVRSIKVRQYESGAVPSFNPTRPARLILG